MGNKNTLLIKWYPHKTKMGCILDTALEGCTFRHHPRYVLHTGCKNLAPFVGLGY